MSEIANRSARSSRRKQLPPPAPEDHWGYFFDIDGTLLDVAASPHLVVVDERLLQLIEALAIRTNGAVAMISGRTIADIDQLFGRAFPAAGQHGIERRSANGTWSIHQHQSSVWEQVRQQLFRVAERHPGLVVEDKGHSLALHYRQAKALASFAHQLMRLMQKELGELYVTQRGKRVIELKPAGIDKGAAIRAFTEEPPFAGRVPLFLGDDVTDEYGFAVVNALDGYSVKVGRGRTAARWRLGSVVEVHNWLDGKPLGEVKK